MKFNEYLSGYNCMFYNTGLAMQYGIPKMPPVEFYRLFSDMMKEQILKGRKRSVDSFRSPACMMIDGSVNIAPYRQCLVEQKWYELQRPYYNVWPGIIGPLAKVKLDTVNCDQIHLPLECIAFRLNDGNDQFKLDNGMALKSFVVSDVSEALMDKSAREFTMWMDFGETIDGLAVWTYRRFLMRSEWTVRQAMDEMGSYEPVPHTDGVSEFGWDACDRVVSLVIGCLLLDSDFVVPDVLNRDKTKPLTDERVKRAHANGKVGWDIGKEIDVNPHWRRPHPALMWTGKGRTIPRVTIRKGAIVKRSVIGAVPTGFMDKELENKNENR